jgi:hypothetical protein
MRLVELVETIEPVEGLSKSIFCWKAGMPEGFKAQIVCVCLIFCYSDLPASCPYRFPAFHKLTGQQANPL